MLIPFVCASVLGQSPSGVPQAVVNGVIRVEAIGVNTVRIELKGPEGFEDRPTFNIVQRAAMPIQLGEKADGDSTLVTGPNWVVKIPTSATSLDGIQVLDKTGTVVYTVTGKETNSEWLPSPSNLAQTSAFAFADAPRIIPPAWGITPPPSGNTLYPETSGWDLGNEAPDVYVILPQGNYKAMRRDFLGLTGAIMMPPLFTFGFIDSKWYEYTEKSAIDLIKEFRAKRIPLDTEVIDTDWRVGGSAGYAVQKKDFPDITRFFKEATALHVHTMFNDHPEPISTSAFDPKELQYRYDGLSTLLKEGLSVWWYDRNWGVSLANPAPDLRHEVWGFKLYHDMTQRAKPNSRALIMANVDGIDNGFRNRPPEVVAHRYPVQWTGDTTSTWASLGRAVDNAVYEGVHGLNAYVNDDLGGHIGLPSHELYARYLEYGAFAPVDRVHCTKPRFREPWKFGKTDEKIVTDYINLRYRLMPVFYEAAWQAHTDGTPLLQRVDLVDSAAPEANRNDEFILGDHLLVAPITESATPGTVVPASAFSGLKAEYFDNQNLKGTPVVTRPETAVDFNWGQGSPDPKVPVDHFSARYTGTITAPTGTEPYRLSVTADDGVRVYLNGKLVVNQWVDEDSVKTDASELLQPGKTYQLKVEYFEDTGNALVNLTWQSAVKQELAPRTVTLPAGSWIDLWSGKKFVGDQEISVKEPLRETPFFVQAGSIIPLAPEMQYTGQKDWSHLTLEVFPGDHDSATQLYEDDGSTLAYKNGAYRTTVMSYQHMAGFETMTVQPSTGTYAGANEFRDITFRVHGVTSVKGVFVNSKQVKDFTTFSQNPNGMPLSGKGSATDGGGIEVTVHHVPVDKILVVQLEG